MEENTYSNKSKHRNEDEKKNLDRRLKIIAGQINGIAQMVENDRYCGDILIQISSASNALKSLGNEILKNHMKTCVVENIQEGNTEIVDELVDLFAKLNK